MDSSYRKKLDLLWPMNDNPTDLAKYHAHEGFQYDL